MARSLISKETVEVLQENAPKDYDVKDNFFNIDVYGVEESKELFNSLYLPEDKKDAAPYLLKLIDGAADYDTDDLQFEDEKPLSVAEKLIHEHKKAAVILLDGERSYVHYK